MKKEETTIKLYIKDNGENEPIVEKVEVADSGSYWVVKIKTRDNPTFEIDQIS